MSSFQILSQMGSVVSEHPNLAEAQLQLRKEFVRVAGLLSVQYVRFDQDLGSLVYYEDDKYRRRAIKRPDLDTVCHIPEKKDGTE